MGKEEGETDAASGDLTASGPDSVCCTRATWKWPIPVIVGAYVLAFAIWSVGFRGSNSNGAQSSTPPPWMPHVEASFRLRRSVLEIHESLPQLQVDLQNEIGIPDTQIDIVSIAPLSYENWTEVRFIVTPERPSDFIALPELSLLKDTFVELFMQRSANLSLTSSVFGSVTHFEVLQFPGGITVVPPQPGFPLSKVLVLFNFTLHNSLSHVHRNFAKFRQQLANGIILKPNENLFVQLTNVDGSTVNSPVVVQTSILPVVGVMLPSPRLKQLAEIIASPRRNLGLNHTLFGRVKKIELSSYLEYSLDSAQAPGPSPSPAPAMSPTASSGSRRHRGFRRHHHHAPSTAPTASPYNSRGRPASSPSPTPEPQQSQHLEGLHPPIYSPNYPSSQFPPSASPSTSSELPPSSNPPLPCSPVIVPSGPSISKPVEHPPSADVWTAAHAPTPLGVPSEAPVGLAPGFSPSPSQLHKRSALTPVAPPSTSSAITIKVSLWAVLFMALSIGIW